MAASCVINRAQVLELLDELKRGLPEEMDRARRVLSDRESVVAVGKNAGKNGLFSYGERMEMIREVTGHLPNVTVEVFDGLLVDFCVERGIPAIVKGLRAVGDFDYELQMSQMNHRLAEVETLFVATNPLYSFLSSSLIKEVCGLGGDVSGLLPEPVLAKLTARLRER